MQFDNPQTQTDPATFSAEPPQRGWFGRNWVWFVPVVILLPLVICAGCCTGVFTIGVGALKSSPPYTEALAAVQEDPRVQESLGTPIEDVTWFPVGEININNDQGDARFDFQVAGPKGRAHVRTESRMIGGMWSITELIVTVEGTEERIVFEPPAPEGVEDAPAWNP